MSAEQIDRAIAEAEANVVMQKTLRNSYVPINRLPVEILSHILQGAAPDRYPWVDEYGRPMRDSDGKLMADTSNNAFAEQIAPSHVCTRWREVALSHSSSWSFIDFRRGEWVLESLSRSRNTLLTVHFTEPHRSAIHSLPLVFNHLARIRSLHISLSPNYRGDFLPISASTEAPFLESITLIASGAYRAPNALPNLFVLQCPRLQRLTLTRCTGIDWRSSLFEPLSLMELNDLPRPARPSMAQLISVVESSRELSVLRLIDSLPSPSDTGEHTVGASRVLPLDHLSELMIGGPFVECADFLRHTSLANTRDLWRHVSEERKIHDLRLDMLYTGATGSVVCLDVSMDKDQLLVKGLDAQKTTVHSMSIRCDRRGDNLITDAEVAGRLLALACYFKNSLHQRLDVRCAVNISPSMWEAALANSTSVHKVVLNARCARGFLEAILPAEYRLSNGAPRSGYASPQAAPTTVAESANLLRWAFLPVPNLRELTLGHIDLGWLEDGIAYWDILCHALSLRRDLGLPLDSLRLWNCRGIPVQAYQTLAGLVGRFIEDCGRW